MPGMKASSAHEWLELVERSGLVVTEVPLHRHFPEGPAPVDPRFYQRVVGRWQRMRIDPGDPRRRRDWDAFATAEILGWPSDRLLRGPNVPDAFRVRPEDVEDTLSPSGVLVDPDGEAFLGWWSVPTGQALDRIERRVGKWRATPQVKLERWMRSAGVSVALLTNGEKFRLVRVPPGLPAGWIEFDAGQWIDERETLAGFRLLLLWDRVAGEAAPSLQGLLEESDTEQTNLTDRLGDQVRQAVEDLLLALDRADHRVPERVLKGVPEDEVYEAAVFVVMRLVFLLFAEERSLLPHGNVFYDEAYGIGRLLHRLQEERRTDPEAFRRSEDAWPRLLALFRLVFEGCAHPDLVLPAYGGDLFQPDRSDALAVLEDPRLKIPNPDVYRVLRSLTIGEVRVGREKLAQRFSYRTLDVEHIGYVYEGLLDHRATRARDEPMVKLRNRTEEAFSLAELESRSGDDLVRFLASAKTLGGDEDRIRAALEEPGENGAEDLAVLDPEVAARCRPYAGVIQTDEVAGPGHLCLTTAASRRATGTHYTPIRYTRAMVKETLDPLVYEAENGKLEEPLRLRSPRELLSLKVCDPAMGSGAFLVQAVRYLGEKLTDAWYRERERQGEDARLYLPYAEPGRDREDRIPLPDEREDAELWARRLVAERCIYGVDRNALATEMAKLSVWLVTLSHERPFSFLDHALRVGDSLVGISDLDQLRTWSLDGGGEQRDTFADLIGERVDEALELREEIASFPVVEPADVARKSGLLKKADEELELLRLLADLLIGPSMKAESGAEEERLRGSVLDTASAHLDGPGTLRERGRGLLQGVRPFHWALEFPEVFGNRGFHAVVGNPPFMGGQKLTGEFGRPYREYLVNHVASGTRGSADLVAYFFHRAYDLMRPGGSFGLLAVNTISEGDTRQVGLEAMLKRGASIFSAHPNEPWPNDAAVVTSRVHVHKGSWAAPFRLRGEKVARISAFLTRQEEWSPKKLRANAGMGFIGSYVLGIGFLLAEEEAQLLLGASPENREVIFPYLVGRDLNQDPEQGPSRWVICFWDWSETEARKFPEPFATVEERVRPQRQALGNNPTDGRRKQYWWLYGRDAKALYHAIGRGHPFRRHPKDWDPDRSPLSRVIVCSLVSKHLTYDLQPNDRIFAHRLAVFAMSEGAGFGFLSSSVNEAWARKQSSTMRVDLNYSPSDAFETLPLPEAWRTDESLESLGRELDALRRAIMKPDRIGLTDLYNRFHDPADDTDGLGRLRELQTEIDQRVLGLYGWDDVELSHDFRDVPYLPENDRHRYTISENARVEILQRLAELNRERYEAEVEGALHDKQKSKSQKGPNKAPESRPNATARPHVRSDQVSLFDGDGKPEPLRRVAEMAPEEFLSEPAARILEWLRSNPGWFGRSKILEGAGVGKGRWRSAVEQLLHLGVVMKQGERRGTRYTISEEE